MGAWGTGNFENDQAADFVAELVAAKDTDPIKTAIEQILFATEESLDADLASRGLAAAEVVAALRRNPGDVPDEVSEWVSGRRAASVELRMMAHSVVIKVLNDSELRELWEETDDFDRWRGRSRSVEAPQFGQAWCDQGASQGAPADREAYLVSVLSMWRGYSVQ